MLLVLLRNLRANLLGSTQNKTQQTRCSSCLLSMSSPSPSLGLATLIPRNRSLFVFGTQSFGPPKRSDPINLEIYTVDGGCVWGSHVSCGQPGWAPTGLRAFPKRHLRFSAGSITRRVCVMRIKRVTTRLRLGWYSQYGENIHYVPI